MGFTVTNCAEFIKLELGGTAGSALPTLELVNMTGFHLCGMSSWRFNNRKSADLNTVAAQTWVLPPSNLGSLYELVAVGGNASYVESDYATIVRQRSAVTVAASGGAYLYAIVDTTPSGSTPGVRHIELSPTPVATATGAIRAVYRAIWANLTSDTDYVPIPDYCKTLFMRILMEHAGGFRRKEQGTLSKRLAELSLSPEFLAAVKQDRAFQPDLGEMRGTLNNDYPIDRGRMIFSGTITGP